MCRSETQFRGTALARLSPKAAMLHGRELRPIARQSDSRMIERECWFRSGIEVRSTGVPERSVRKRESAADGSNTTARIQRVAATKQAVHKLVTARQATPKPTNGIGAHVTLISSFERARRGGRPGLIRTSLCGGAGGLSPGPMLARGFGIRAPQARCARNGGAFPAPRRATRPWSPSTRRGSSPGDRRSSPRVEPG
jgi:hypothetical protein